jgi:lipopolysaccharide export system permease protein
MNLRLRIGRLELYVLARTLTAVAWALGVIAFVIMLIDFVELSRTVGVRAREASAFSLLTLTLLESPSVILQLLPFAFLFGVLGAYVNLNRRSELIAMRAAGVSAWRFILPAAVAAAVIGAATTTVLNPVAARMNGEFQRRQSELMEGYLPGASKAVWMRQGDGQEQIIIRAGSREGPGLQLKDVTLFFFQVDSQGGLIFTRRLDAEAAQLRRGALELTGVQAATPGSVAMRLGKVTVPSPLNEATAIERFASPQAVPFWSLPRMIAETEKAGFSATAYRLQLYQLLATPLMFAAMSILAAAFSLRLLRLGGLGALAGSGVALGFVFFFFNQLCSSLGRAGVVPPLLAAWTPPVLVLLAGVTLLFYTEDG